MTDRWSDAGQIDEWKNNITLAHFTTTGSPVVS